MLSACTCLLILGMTGSQAVDLAVLLVEWGMVARPVFTNTHRPYVRCKFQLLALIRGPKHVQMLPHSA